MMIKLKSNRSLLWILKMGFYLSVNACTLKKEITGNYVNASNSSYQLIISKDEYVYKKNGTIFNKGTWSHQNNGWDVIELQGWVDHPDFNLFNCKTKCLSAEMTYSDGTLISIPDNHSLNFVKRDEQ